MPRRVGRSGGNLPVTTTSFVGRDRELHEGRRILRAHRILTLVGGGGVGKTRLAVHLGARMARDFPGGVWLVDLAPLGPGADVGGVVSAALPDGLPGDTSSLLILDTCERLPDECGAFVSELIKYTGTRILVTGRRPLAVLGEHLLEVKPFGTPDAIKLFAERAPGFSLPDETAPEVAEICSRLDGLPLAIELAAARLRALSLPELLATLEDPDQLLSLGNRIAPPRRRSLGDLCAWSHALCTPPERDLWARLSVFAGDFDLAAAESICEGGGIAVEDVLDLVAGLVDKSVVLRTGDACYSLPGIARRYGAKQLSHTGESDHFQDRQATYFLGLARKLLDRLREEGIPGVHAAMRRASRDFSEAAAYLAARPGFGDDVLDLRTLLHRAPADPARTAEETVASGDSAALARLENAFHTYGEQGDQFRLRQCARRLAVVAWNSSDRSAPDRVKRLVEHATLTTGPCWRPLRTVLLALAQLRDDSPGKAEKSFRRALAELRNSGEYLWIALCCEGMALCAQASGNPVRAARLLGFSRSMTEQTLGEVIEYATGVSLAEPDPAGTSAGSGLTPREYEVAELIRDGLTNQAIGAELGISKRTVEAYVVRAMAKLGFSRRSQISAWIASERRFPLS
ncbi:LuxR C-terminal-related transcriptional regulator [Amycolatopsis sp. NPDC051071]|uniref:helix-turn-helix transcriptional regulator n=1 Tax=Amycolatopsis sp. NPDC051071 TaxID=3154637 RepID=UPI003417842B